MIKPFVISGTRIESQCGASAYGEFIVIPRTAAQLINMPRQKTLEELRAGIRLAGKHGADIVGLGAFTSVVSAGGLYLQEEGIPLTTGNSYTVVSAADAIISALEKLHVSPEESCAAVVVATGSIGKGTAMLLSEVMTEIVLIGNPAHEDKSLKRLMHIAGEIYQYIAYLIKEKRNFRPYSMGWKLMQMQRFPQWNPSTIWA